MEGRAATQSYEILSEEGGTEPRFFKVRVTLVKESRKKYGMRCSGSTRFGSIAKRISGFSRERASEAAPALPPTGTYRNPLCGLDRLFANSAKRGLCSSRNARAALDAYLRAWSHGEMVQSIPDTNPPVMATDELRLKGRVLKSYRILGQVPADAPVCFAVELKLDNPAADLRERYVVVGIDPLWVWRYDDYLMMMHWDHPMPEDGKASPRPKK